MITRFLTEVTTVFNPFSPKAKTARLFLSFLPPNARSSMKIDTKLLPRASKEGSLVRLKFSKLYLSLFRVLERDAARRGIRGMGGRKGRWELSHEEEKNEG
jgi:large subunit ribosomal protein L53